MAKKYLQNEEIGLLCRELALLLHAGVTVGDGLSLMAEEEQGSTLGQVLDGLCRQVDEGQPLAQAVQASEYFPPYVCSLLTVGQRTGRLEQALEALNQYYDQRQRMETRIKTALTYPTILLLVMMVVIVVLLTRVLPLFRTVYAGLGGAFSGLAAGLYRVGQVLDGMLPFLCVLLLAALALLAAFCTSDAFRQHLLSFWQRLRGDKGTARSLNQARLAQGLAMGMSAGLTGEQALEQAQALLGESVGLQENCQTCIALLNQGDSLARALEKAALLPPRECRILELAARSGAGDQAMADIARRLEEQSELQLSRCVERVEPVMVIVTSLLVGGILLSVMLPLMQILASIG